jgi:hypothetical protein
MAEPSSPLRLRLNRLDPLGHSDPPLCAFRPDEVTRPQPAGVVQRAGLENENVFRIARDMIDPHPALRAEHAGVLITAVGDPRESLGRARHRQVGFVHQRRHAERAAGLALAFLAVTGDQPSRLGIQHVAERAALAASCIWCGHSRTSPSQMIILAARGETFHPTSVRVAFVMQPIKMQGGAGSTVAPVAIR